MTSIASSSLAGVAVVVEVPIASSSLAEVVVDVADEEEEDEEEAALLVVFCCSLFFSDLSLRRFPAVWPRRSSSSFAKTMEMIAINRILMV